MAANCKYRGPDGFTQFLGNQDDLGQIVSLASAEVDSTRVKFCVENIGDRPLGVSPFSALVLRRVQVGANDGWTYVLTTDGDPNGTISKPWGLGVDSGGARNGAPVATLAGPYGSWASTGAKGVVVTAVKGAGETIASVEVTFTVAGLSEEWLIEWEDVPGADSYNVYGTDTPGSYGASSFLANVAISQYSHDGASPSSGQPPSANTTGGAGPTYGTPPSFVSFTGTDKTIALAGDGGLAPGQQWFAWFVAKIPAGSIAAGNKRVMKLFPKEV